MEVITDVAFEVEFRRSGVVGMVPPGSSILAAAERAGIAADWSCRAGRCGSCETPLLDGNADHRDELLTDEEQQAQDTVMICVSRAAPGCDRLVVDL